MTGFYPAIPDRCRYWHHNGETWARCRALVSAHDGHHAHWHEQMGDTTTAPTIATERTV